MEPGEVHYRVHKSWPVVRILSQVNPIQSSPPYFSKPIIILYFHLHLGLSTSLFPSGFPTVRCCTFQTMRKNVRMDGPYLHIIYICMYFMIKPHNIEPMSLRKAYCHDITGFIWLRIGTRDGPL